MIDLVNVSKIFPDGTEAVNNISFTVEKGEFFLLVGVSGCGKTTTLKMINRLIERTSGDIIINGVRIEEINKIELRRSIGYVIQQVGLFPHMTISENISLIPQLKKWHKEKIKKRTNEMLELMGLEPGDYLEKYPNQLSGGQKQRIGVARALSADPEIVLMDEPFGALDPITREQIQDEFLKLQKKLKKTIVFVTHDIIEAIKLADRMAIMRDGEIVQIGTPVDMIDNPEDEFIHQFIGGHRFTVEDTYIKMEEIIQK